MIELCCKKIKFSSSSYGGDTDEKL